MIKTFHGKSYTKIYHVWQSMKSRCTNPKNAAFHNYGGRGILVCDKWMDFTKFYQDVGDPPIGMSLDRIDNNLGYSPDNVRWADRKTQRINCRDVFRVSNEIKSIDDFGAEAGLKKGTVWARIKKGWKIEDAISKPPIHQRDRNIKRNRPRSYKTHCKNGHAMTEENTLKFLSLPNKRICRTCRIDTVSRRKAKILQWGTENGVVFSEGELP